MLQIDKDFKGEYELEKYTQFNLQEQKFKQNNKKFKFVYQNSDIWKI